MLPDFERWPDNYVHISFDNDPVSDHPRLSQLSPAQRREYAGEDSFSNSDSVDSQTVFVHADSLAQQFLRADEGFTSSCRHPVLVCAEQAVVKSYSISVGGNGTKVDRFVAYMVPAEELPSREPDDNEPADRFAAPT